MTTITTTFDFDIKESNIKVVQEFIREVVKRKFSKYREEQKWNTFAKEDAEMIRELRKSPGRHEGIKNDLKRNKAFFSQFPSVTASGK